jgi:hypothetical protein
MSHSSLYRSDSREQIAPLSVRGMRQLLQLDNPAVKANPQAGRGKGVEPNAGCDGYRNQPAGARCIAATFSPMNMCSGIKQLAHR